MELSWNLSLVYVPKTISELLKEVSMIKNGFQRLSKISDYVKRLEDEMKKIDGFKRELPLCMLLLTDAGIERLKDEEKQCMEMNDNGRVTKENDGGDKKNWMSSVQLWNCDFSNNNNNVDHNKQPNTAPELKLRSEEEEEEDLSENPIELCNNKIGGVGDFVPIKGQVDKEISGLSPVTPSFELAYCNPILKSCRIGSGSSFYAEPNQFKFQTNSRHQRQEQQQQQNSRKQRRCCLPELHRRFIEALQQLGGSQVATPKQIRELMQVDGLTRNTDFISVNFHLLQLEKETGYGRLKINATST